MTNEFILHQNSPNQILENYFTKIFELEITGESFPVDLDEVWKLVYARRGAATEALRDNFEENFDYQILTENRKNPLGGRPNKVYRLSVPCLEFFIARKIRPVFEVYRRATRAFRHLTATTDVPVDASATQILDLFNLKYQAIRQQQLQLEELKARVQEMETKTLTQPECYTVCGYANLVGEKLTLSLSAAIGRKATKYCKENDIEVDDLPDLTISQAGIWDTRYGKVNVYPKDVLVHIFEDLF